MAKQFKLLEVTTTTLYLIPMIDNEISEINGWDIETIKKDWFEDINRSHATREAYEIGHSKRVVNAEIAKSELALKILTGAKKILDQE